MFTGLVTLATIYMTVGVTMSVTTDETGKKSGEVLKVVKDAIKWPLDIYNKLN